MNNDYIVYYDHYRDPKRYEAARSPDLENWAPITDLVQFPADCRHGSLLRISPKERTRLEAR